MSDERETPASRAAETPEPAVNPGAPVEETETSHTEVLAAVERANGQSDESAELAELAAALKEASEGGSTPPDASQPTPSSEGSDGLDPAERTRREVISAIDTELDMELGADAGGSTPRAQAGLSDIDGLPSAAADPGAADLLGAGAAGAGAAGAGAAGAGAAAEAEPALDTPERDGEIRISADHPMAALYMQTPMPPEIRGNRGAGVLISVVATIGFALVYAGALALWVAPTFPPSTFFSEGLVPWLTSGVFLTSLAAFFVGLVLLVLIVGRAGWWAYVLGGFFVAAFVWVAALVALALFGAPNATPQEMLPGMTLNVSGAPSIVARFGFSVPALAAAIVAREAAVWFGAWIGARGRRMKLRNAEALAEYEEALAEVQAQQP